MCMSLTKISLFAEMILHKNNSLKEPLKVISFPFNSSKICIAVSERLQQIRITQRLKMPINRLLLMNQTSRTAIPKDLKKEITSITIGRSETKTICTSNNKQTEAPL
jgi:hypothetical protein